MKRFWKLLNFEVSRFILLFAIMMGAAVGVQLTQVVLTTKHYLQRVHTIMEDNRLTYETYASQYGIFEISQTISSFAFIGPIMFVIAVLVIYTFFIWYRDWFGKANFSYRLMMLPMQRISVYFAKLTSLLLFIFAALAVEVAVLYIMFGYIENTLPAELYNAYSLQVIYFDEIYALVLPTSLKLFLFNYVIGITAVTVVFTMVLFERSFRLKGIFFSIAFAVAMLAIILAPIVYQAMTSMLFLNEMYLIVSVIALIICGVSILTSNYLLKHKINV